MNKKEISIICGGPSSEHPVSIKSAQAILDNINRDKYIPHIFYISKDTRSSLYKPNKKISIPPKKKLEKLSTEILKLKTMFMNIVALHGQFGEDGTVQGILESLNIPYTGSKKEASSLCINKYQSSLLVNETTDLAIPETKLLNLKDLLNRKIYSRDVCIKPNKEGSSIGVYIIKSQKQLSLALNDLRKDFDLNTEFLLQDLVKYDWEVSCGCLQEKNGRFTKLPPIEIIPKNSDFFDYKSKYSKGSCTEITPPKHINPNLASKISQLAIDIHKALGCSLYSRSDFLVNNNEIYYLETNTLPGMTETSLFPQEAQAAGIKFKELVDFLIENS